MMTAKRVALLTLLIATALLPRGEAAHEVLARAGENWTRTGSAPNPVYSLATDPGNPATVYALGSEGISRSGDSGATWTLCARDARFMRLVVGQAVTNTVLYSGGPSGFRQSTDGCATWRDVPSSGISPAPQNVRWLSPYPNNSAVLYAGIDGMGGLYRSMDTGATWQAASRGLPSDAWVTALTADPLNPERIIVGLRYTAAIHPPAYIYRSTDGGLSWRSASMGLHVMPHTNGEITGLAWSGDKLFAATSFDGLFVSGDQGVSWRRAVTPRRTESQSLTGSYMPLGISSVMANPDGALLINTSQGAFRSIDGAQTWQLFGPDSSSAPQTLALAGSRVIVADRSGLWNYTMQSGIVALPTATTGTVAQVATPPPPPALPTSTPEAPTATEPPAPTATQPPPTRPPGYLPTDKAEPLDSSIASYFTQTGHNVSYGFHDYWQANNGIALLGYPLTEAFEENGVTVQYFERGRLEYRDKQVVRGLIGTELTKGRFFQPIKFFPSVDDNVYFGPTQHSISGPFLTFWRDNGRFDTFGYPLSQSLQIDGSEYQWFERARLEWHPFLPEGKRIVLGPLGTELLQKRGWIK